MDVHSLLLQNFFFIWSPLLLALWLLPWLCIAIWIDNGWPRQFTLASLLLGVAVCSVEMAATFWFGPKLIATGIAVAGVTAFLPTILGRWFLNSRRRGRPQPVTGEVVAAQIVDELG